MIDLRNGSDDKYANVAFAIACCLQIVLVLVLTISVFKKECQKAKTKIKDPNKMMMAMIIMIPLAPLKMYNLRGGPGNTQQICHWPETRRLIKSHKIVTHDIIVPRRFGLGQRIAWTRRADKRKEFFLPAKRTS